MYTVLEIKPCEIHLNGKILLPRQALIKRQILSFLAKQYCEDCLRNTAFHKAFTPKDIAHNLNRTEWDAVYQINRHIRSLATRLEEETDQVEIKIIEIILQNNQKTYRLNPKKVQVMISPFQEKKKPL
ncbi:MAG: hypothetical protein K2W94_03145 [Alphaproteobacteria bacterium]|nr:hypothetical protein [Alphaproteobacteria bacterium]